MLEESIQETDNQRDHKGMNHVGQKYLEHQLSWFEKTYCLDNDISFIDKDKAQKEFIVFLDTYAKSGKKILVETEEEKEFTAKFIELFDAAYYKSDKNNRKYGAKKMNDLLEEQHIGYKIDGKPQAGPWTVIRFDWSKSNKESKTK